MGTLLTEPLREDESVRECKMNRMREIPEAGRTDEGLENTLACEDAGLECCAGEQEEGGREAASGAAPHPTPAPYTSLLVILWLLWALLLSPFSYEETKSQRKMNSQSGSPLRRGRVIIRNIYV